MRGITFKLKNEYNNFLFKIFSNIEVGDFVWVIGNNEIIYKDKENNLNVSIFDEAIMNGQDFLRNIEAGDYYLVYADIKAFNNLSKITNVTKYDDFVNSYCEIALFCTDTIYVELYCKDKIILNKIIENCHQFRFSDIQILTKQNDSRREFSV